MSISEPVTLLTDYALAATCGYLAWQLHRRHEDQVSRKCWVAGFAALAVAAFAGGTHHGLAPHLSSLLLAATWKFAVYGISLFGLAMVAGSIFAACRGTTRRVLLSLAILKFAACAVVLLQRDTFEIVIADTGVAMLALLLLHGWQAAARRDRASPWVLAAVAVSALAAAVQYGRISLHAHFNHNDLYHVIQILGMILFFKAGKLLRDATANLP